MRRRRKPTVVQRIEAGDKVVLEVEGGPYSPEQIEAVKQASRALRPLCWSVFGWQGCTSHHRLIDRFDPAGCSPA